MRSIEIIVTPQAEIQVKAVGFKGNACAKATEAIEKAMGIPTKEQKLPEYYACELATTKVGGG